MAGLGVRAPEIEQAGPHQIPLILDRVQAAHSKLAKTQNTPDPADGRFHPLFALGVSCLTVGGVQLGLGAAGGRPPGTPP